MSVPSQCAAEGDDVLLTSGVRTASVAEARQAFIEGPVSELAQILGVQVPAVAADAPAGWDARRRRVQGSQMPETLWEAMLPSSDEAVLARRPLSVSIEDNIDLFDKAS